MSEPELMDLLRDGAVRRDEARSRRRMAIGQALRLSSSERLGHVVEIEVDGAKNECTRFVAEVITAPPGSLRKIGGVDTSLWAVGAGDYAAPRRFHSVDQALLASVEWRHNGSNIDARGWVFAARALGVSMEES